MSNETSTLSGNSELLLAEVTDEFLDRLHRGEQPEIEEYAERHPEIAVIIRQVFPALQVLRLPGGNGVAANDASKETDGLAGRLGDYRIIREIGRGGMGIVYEAEQVSLGRRVALKVLPFAAVLDSKQLQRFKNEAQAAAHLHHNNIVPVFSVGSERGVHYYAMQYIEGVTLAEVISELRRIATPGNDSPVDAGSSAALDAFAPERSTRSPAFFRSVAQLGVQAAEALQHAHDLGVVHRDIKPSNLLLDERGSLWVTDFGLARLESNPDLTLTGDLLGTVRYMSPEQALGKPVGVDQRTDIYSLGVTLYELLTLRPAVDATDRQTMLRRIEENDPRPPRRINDAIPSDLETIVLKAIAKEPGGRYATAKALSDDLRRFLDDKPIRAKRPTLMELATKWSRRHRHLVASAAVVLILAVVGLSLSTVIIARERNLAEQRRVEAERQRERAHANFQKARDAVDQMLTEVSQKDLADVPGMAPVQQALLEKALRFYRDFLDEKSDDPAVRRETAHAHKRVGDILDQLARHDESAQYHQEAGEIFEQLSAEFRAMPQQREQLAGALTSLASVHKALGRREQAEQSYREALSVWQELATASPSSAELRQRVADCFYELGHQLFPAGRSDEALAAHRNTLRIYEKLADEFTDEPAYTFRLAQCRNDLATFLYRLGRSAEAMDMMQAAAEVFATLAADSPDKHIYRADLARVRYNLGTILSTLNRFEEAEPALRTSIELREELAADFPHRPIYRGKLLDSLNNLGTLFQRANRIEDATKAYRRVLTVSEELVADYPTTVRFRLSLSNALQNLATLRGGSVAEAEQARALLERAIDQTRKAIEIIPNESRNRLQLGRQFSNLWGVLESLEHLEQAETAIRRAVDISRKLVAEFPDRPMYRSEFATALYNLGNRLRTSDRSEEGERVYREALESLERLVQESPQVASYRHVLAVTRHNLGMILDGDGRREQAEQAFRASLALKKALVAEVPQQTRYRQDLAKSHRSLAELLSATDRPAEAVQQWREALDDCPDDAGLHNSFASFRATCPLSQFRNIDEALEHAARAVALDPENGGYHYTRGVALYRADDSKAAEEAFEKAIELYGGEANAWEWFLLAMTRWQLGDKERARELYDRAVEWTEQNEPDSNELGRLRAEAAELMGRTEEVNGEQEGVATGGETESRP